MSKHSLKLVSTKKEQNIYLEEDGGNTYNVFRKDLLKLNLSTKIYNMLSENGLYQCLDSANNEHNSLCSVHRLAICLRFDVLGKIIHHIDKNKKNNTLINLLPISTKEEHTLLDGMSPEQCIIKSKELHDKYNFELPLTKNTIANNPNIVKAVLNNPTLKAKTLEKVLNKKIKRSTISKIRQYYNYGTEFLEWLKTNENKSYTELCRSLGKSWSDLLEFEKNVIAHNPKYQAYFS